jgi:hypothetical protein
MGQRSAKQSEQARPQSSFEKGMRFELHVLSHLKRLVKKIVNEDGYRLAGFKHRDYVKGHAVSNPYEVDVHAVAYSRKRHVLRVIGAGGLLLAFGMIAAPQAFGALNRRSNRR